MTKTIAIVCFAVLLVTISASACQADDQLPSEALGSIKKICPEAPRHPMVVATGDLNEDGVSDVAAIVSCKSTENGEPQDGELIVLYGQQGGTYKIAYRSEVWDWQGSRRTEFFLKIRKNILLLTLGCAYGCSPESGESFSYKFKLHHNEFVLAGEDYSSSVFTGKDLEFEETVGHSVNYLTQKVIYWKKTTSRGHSEKKLAFKLKAPLAFSSFNLDTCRSNTNNRFCMPSVSIPEP